MGGGGGQRKALSVDADQLMPRKTCVCEAAHTVTVLEQLWGVARGVTRTARERARGLAAVRSIVSAATCTYLNRAGTRVKESYFKSEIFSSDQISS